jgi:phosphate starvation-inducible PhoH-like protein
MEQSHNFEQADLFRISLQLSPDFANHLRTVETELQAAVKGPMAPYSAEFRIIDHTVNISGDEPGAIILQRLIEMGGEAFVSRKSMTNIWTPEAIVETMEGVLQRDLAFRVPGLRKAVRPMSTMQHAFMAALLAKDPPLLIGAGPTGTGKTHLAIAAGLNLVEEGKFRTLVIARPHVVEQGEVVTAEMRADTTYDSQFAAIEDELNGLIGPEEVRHLQTSRRLEVMPIGHLRGRTFQNAFIIIDEAQNMNVRKMRMAVTRLGSDSRMVLTGDPGNYELREEGPSGLGHLIDMVGNSDIARVFRFTARQIVRNSVVAELEALYRADEGDPSY